MTIHKNSKLRCRNFKHTKTTIWTTANFTPMVAFQKSDQLKRHEGCILPKILSLIKVLMRLPRYCECFVECIKAKIWCNTVQVVFCARCYRAIYCGFAEQHEACGSRNTQWVVFSLFTRVFHGFGRKFVGEIGKFVIFVFNVCLHPCGAIL